jgi:hypothetical protein
MARTARWGLPAAVSAVPQAPAGLSGGTDVGGHRDRLGFVGGAQGARDVARRRQHGRQDAGGPQLRARIAGQLSPLNPVFGGSAGVVDASELYRRERLLDGQGEEDPLAAAAGGEREPVLEVGERVAEAAEQASRAGVHPDGQQSRRLLLDGQRVECVTRLVKAPATARIAGGDASQRVDGERGGAEHRVADRPRVVVGVSGVVGGGREVAGVERGEGECEA